MNNEDGVIKKLEEHDKQFDSLGAELRDFKQRALTAQDEMITILRRLDEERVFTAAWIQRVEKEVEEHGKEIARIKAALKIG